ncbi:MAG: M23 family metallopeptidase [Tetrasphaera sp.]|nr:M23 family metallopeptidase [Tetrasphaera sp.]
MGWHRLVFAHLSEIDVTGGQHVRPGTYVGKSGNTGHSTGPHLHMEIHPKGGEPIDPLPWLKAHGINVRSL